MSRMILPKLTKKQSEIIRMLFKYRYLNRIQIQAMLEHRDYKRVNIWLKDLTEKQYVRRIYSTHFAEKCKPAIYYLGINGIRYLKQQTVIDEDGDTHPVFQLSELNKRYYEHNRSEAFRKRSMLLADCCISLTAMTAPNLRYDFAPRSVFINPRHDYNFLAAAVGIAPDLCIVGNKYASSEDTTGRGIVTNYLLEIFDPTTSRYTMLYRIKKYIEYISNDEWGSDDNDPSPIILLALPRLTDLIYAKRKAKSIIDQSYDEDDEDRPCLRFTTTEQLKGQSITARIWEEGRSTFML